MLQWGRERGLAARWVTGLVTIGADGLNGAASARSRKCPSPEWSRFARTASMGPRARARGNARSISRSMWRGWLQWGRERALAEIGQSSSTFRTAAHSGFNGAASARSRKSASQILLNQRIVMLQWGRERALAEIQPRECRPVVFGLLQWGRERALAEICRQENAQGEGQGASMGPRARARGNGFRPGGNGLNRHASMGPRARARGNTVTSESFGVLIRLQWGRERALAEMPSSSTAAAWVGFASMGPRARARGNSLPHTLFNFQRP